MVTNEMIEVCLQPIQEKYVKISLLQNYFVQEGAYKARRFKKVGEIQGNTVGGSITIDTKSAVRRTCSIDMVITDSSFLIGEDTKIWMDKWFRIELGIKSFKTGRIVWFNKGIYAINNPSIKYNSKESSLKLQGLDLMATLDGTLGGSLKNITKIDVGTPISEAIKRTVCELGGFSERDIFIEQNTVDLPFSIEKRETETVYSILDDIRNLYMDWEFFFDVNGRFIYKKIENRLMIEQQPGYKDHLIQFDFLEEHEVISDYNYSLLFTNVKNRIVVWGRLSPEGVQTQYELVNTDQNSPFNIHSNIGEIPLTIVDTKIYENDQAKARGDYEFYKHNNMNEKVSIQSLPLYFLEVNKMINFNKPEIGLEGKFLIESITIPLGIDGQMNIESHKVYAQ